MAPYVTLMLCLCALPAAELDRELRFIEGLQVRGLYRLAEIQGDRLLGEVESGSASASDAGTKDPATDWQRAQIAIQVIQVYTAHALNSPREQREQQWGRLDEFVQRELARLATQPGRLLAQLQASLARLARAELARQETEVMAQDDNFELPRQQLRAVIRELETVDEALQDPRLLVSPRERASSFDEQQRDHVRNRVQFHLAQAYRNQALCYPPRSADRISSLAQAKQRLVPVARLQTSDPLVDQSQFDLLLIDRLLGNFSAAASGREELARRTDSTVPAALLVAEHVHWLLDQQRTAEALTVAAQGEQQAPYQQPELDLAWLAALLARLKNSPEANGQEITAWQSQAAQLAAEIGNRHGAYWGHRANMQLAQIAESSRPTPGSLELLRQTADSFLARNLPDEAVAAYVRAAARAAELERLDVAFELAYKAGLVDHQRGAWRAAIQQLRATALSHPTDQRAPEAHLLAAFDCSQWIREFASAQLDPSRPPVRATTVTDVGQVSSAAEAWQLYQQLLHEHLAQWPRHGETADKARAWLGRFYESNQDWSAAVSVYEAMSAEADDNYGRLELLTNAYRRLLAPATGAAEEALLTQIRHWFDQSMQPRTSERPWNQADARAALYAARWQLTGRYVDFAAAEQRLRLAVEISSVAALNANANALRAERGRSGDSDVASSAQCLLAVALAGQEKWSQAVEALQLPRVPSLEVLREPLQLVRDTMDRQWPTPSRQWEPVLQELLPMFTTHRGEFTEFDRPLLESLQADLLAWTDQEQAIQVYRNWAKQRPNDERTQIRLAQLLLGSQLVASQSQALAQWRLVAQRTRPETDGWFQAKFGLAAAHFRSGDKKQACDIIRLTQSLHPAMGGDKRKAEFMQLLNQCEQ